MENAVISVSFKKFLFTVFGSLTVAASPVVGVLDKSPEVDIAPSAIVQYADVGSGVQLPMTVVDEGDNSNRLLSALNDLLNGGDENPDGGIVHLLEEYCEQKRRREEIETQSESLNSSLQQPCEAKVRPSEHIASLGSWVNEAMFSAPSESEPSRKNDSNQGSDQTVLNAEKGTVPPEMFSASCSNNGESFATETISKASVPQTQVIEDRMRSDVQVSIPDNSRQDITPSSEGAQCKQNENDRMDENQRSDVGDIIHNIAASPTPECSGHEAQIGIFSKDENSENEPQCSENTHLSQQCSF